MGKILFVHGTGVRSAAFERSLALITAKVKTHLPRYDVAGCNWGDAFGARLNDHGSSIPGYVDGGAGPAIEAADMARWSLLTDDPLLELRVTEMAASVGVSPGPVVWGKLLATPGAPQLSARLSEWGMDGLWPTFIAHVAADAGWRLTVDKLRGTQGELAAPVARALVAAFSAWLRPSGQPGLTGVQRDLLAVELQQLLTGPGLGVRDWLLDRLTNFMVPRRDALSDASGAAVGDVLRYQARGGTLRNFIGDCVERTGANVILAHSLGGVASVDWLATASRNLTALVTVGSQAPFFYEIDALASRPYGAGLPDFFPQHWLNFYDPRDFLSYAGQKIFNGCAHDVEVNNGQPFPESHSAYWHNDAEVWKAIDQFLP